MLRRLIILLLIVGCVFANEDTYDRIYYDTGLILNCVEISSKSTIRIDEWNFFMPIDINMSCLAPISNFSTLDDGTLGLKNAPDMYWYVSPDENGNRRIDIQNIKRIDKVIYKNGDIKTSKEIQLKYSKWKIGVNFTMVGILILLVNIT